MRTSNVSPKWRSRFTSLGLALLVLAAGGATFAALYVTAPAPDRDDAPAPPRTVRAFVTHAGPHRIAITSYGQSQAADDWTARAEVEANVKDKSLHVDFDDGHVVQKGEVLLEFDATDFQHAVSVAQADEAAFVAQLRELELRKENDEPVLDLHREQLKFVEADFERSKRQLRDGVITPATHQRVEASFVERRAAVKDLENAFELIPIQIQRVKAQKDAATIRVKQALRDVERCKITMPFTGLCIGREVEEHEHVDRGQSLGTFIALDKAEVLAMVEPRKALMLFPNAKHEFYGSIDLTSDTFNSVIRERLDRFQVPADVTWRVGERRAQWRGRATRVSAIVDERSRTAPAVIEVKKAFTDIRPGVRPALVPGMFLEVTLYGALIPDAHVIPRDALREGHVYIERDGKLVIQPVKVAALEEEIAVLTNGLEDGDKVIVTDLFPAANGMRVAAETIPNPVTHRPELPELESDLTPD